MKHIRVKVGLTLLAALSITLLCTSPAKAATTKITNGTCPVQITASGDYTLDTRVGPCAPGVTGIIISVKNVTLHLNGHSIDGPFDGGSCFGNNGMFGYDGILITNADSTSIVGPGEIRNFEYGVYGYASPGSTVSFTRVTANPCLGDFGEGIYLDGSEPNDHWTLLANVVRRSINSIGIGLFGGGSSNNKIVGNSVNNSIVLTFSSGNIIAGNSAIADETGNGDGQDTSAYGGIVVYSGGNNQILSNTTERNAGTTPYGGIVLTGGTTGNLISLNTSLHNSPWDMEDDSPCGANKWVNNDFKTANESCIH